MQFKIKVIDVTGPTKVNKGKGYNEVKIAYEKDGQVEGKKLVDFAVDPAVFAAVCSAKNKEEYTVTAEKETGTDGKGYWVWKGFEKIGVSGTSAQSETQQPNPIVESKGTGRVTGSNYETPEERKLRRDFETLKHRQIGRQGCINSSIAILSASGEKFGIDEVVVGAKKLEQFVFEVSPAERFADMKDDIPF